MNRFRYATSQIAVHWLAAALIVFLLVTGTFVLAEMPNTADKIGNFRIHMILGALAAGLVVARVLLRRVKPRPPAVVAEKWAHLGHMGLNLLVMLLAGSVASGRLRTLVALPGMVASLQPQLQAEEAALGRLFGDDYVAYRQRVRRWL